MFVDTHCHINLLIKNNFNMPLSESESDNAQTVIDRANAAGVNTIVTVATSLCESLNALALADRYKNVFATAGIHPSDITQDFKSDFDAIKKLVTFHKNTLIVGVGECGLDRKYPGLEDIQKDVFKRHIDLALEHKLPLIIHARDAYDEVFEILDEFRGQNLTGIMHCFSGNLSHAHEAINRGLYLGIGGTVTYPKNHELRLIVKTLGPDHIVLETDAPFLPPQTMRGKTNEPAYIKIIAEYIANLLSVDIGKIGCVTTQNAKNIFNFPARD